MQKETKIALAIGTGGLVLNQLQKQKLRNSAKGYLEKDEERLKMLGATVAVLGYTSAGILELTKNHPNARKYAFIGLGVGTVGFFAMIISALKKMN